MRKFLLGASTIAVILAFAGLSHTAEVIVPVGGKPCEIKEKDVVRITAKGIAGSTIKVAVKGQAKQVKKTKVIERAGKQNVIGSTVEEYEFQTTGKGKATVEVTITPPNGKPEVKEYEFVVK